jgi:hypothetical protein
MEERAALQQAAAKARAMTLDVDVVAGEALKPVGALRSTIESMLQLPADVVLQRVFLVLLTPMQLRCGAGRHSRIRGQPMRLLSASEDSLTLFDLGIEQEETSVRLRVEMGKRPVQPVPVQATEALNLPSTTSTTIMHAPAVPLMSTVARTSSEGPSGVRNGLHSSEASPQPGSSRSASGDCAMASPASSGSGGGSTGSPATPARPQQPAPAPASSRVHAPQSSCMSISQEDASEHARMASSSSTGAGALPQPPLAAAENARALAAARLVGDVTGIEACVPLSDACGAGEASRNSSAPPLASPALSTTAKPTLPDLPAPSAAHFGVSPASRMQAPQSTSSAASGSPAASLLGSPPLSGRPAALASPPPSAVRRRNSLEVMMRAAHSLTSRDSVALLRSSAGSPRSAASSSDDENEEAHGARHSRSGSAPRSAAPATAAAVPGAGPLMEGSVARGGQGFGTPSMHHQSSSSDPSPLEGAAGRGSSGSMLSTGSVGRADVAASTAATAAASSAHRTTSGPRRRALNTAASARSAMLSPSEHYSPAAPVTGGGALFFGRGGSPSGFAEGAAAGVATGSGAAGGAGAASARSTAMDPPAGDAAGSAVALTADAATAAGGAGAGPARPSFAAVVQAITFARTLAKHAKENIARERRRVSGPPCRWGRNDRLLFCGVFLLGGASGSCRFACPLG